jgi:hypothetical protein
MIEEKVLAALADDRFNRGAIVDQIQNLIVAAPFGGGMRIAIFGDWGSGKSSIAEWVMGRLPKAKWISIRLTAWSVSSEHDFWNLFGLKLVEAINERGLVDLGVGKKVYAWTADWTRKLSEYMSAGKADQNYGALFRAGTTALSLGQDFVEGILQKLRDTGFTILMNLTLKR